MLDAELLLSGSISAAGVVTGQAITGDETSASWDLESARDVGAGQYINFNFLVTEDFDELTSLQIEIESSADDITFVDLLLSPVILLASLVEGMSLIYTLPRKQLLDPVAGVPNRYLRAAYNVTGNNPTTGAIACWITGAEKGDAFQAYPSGFSNAYGS